MNKQNRTKTRLCFKRWKRAPWAVFASLGKVIKIGVMSATCSLLVLKSQPVTAVEMMDRAAVKSVDSAKGVPEYLKELHENGELKFSWEIYEC